MNIRTTLITTGLIAASLVSGAAQAALQGRDLNGSAGSFEAYYDTELDITWLATANNTGMDWATANTWAANLSFTDGVNVYDNWRLPTVNPVNGVSFNYGSSYNGYGSSYDGSTDRGYNISAQGSAFAGSTSSEMAHLFYNTLNNKSYCPVSTDCLPYPQTGWGLTNSGPFTNLQAFSYWSATSSPPNTSYYAWYFNFNAGDQQADGKEYGLYALAVSPGDVGAVPEAETYALMLAGLGLIGWRARRRG